MDREQKNIIFAPIRIQTNSFGIELLQKVTCEEKPPIGFTYSIEQQHNCNLSCASVQYMNLYKVGDILPFQFNMQWHRIDDSSTNNQLIGWHQQGDNDFDYAFKAELYGIDCDTPIYTLVNDFTSDYWSGFSNITGSVQTLFVDTAKFPDLYQFRLRISSVEKVRIDDEDVLQEVEVYWSEPFVKADPCIETVFIQSWYESIDNDIYFNHDYRDVDGVNIKAVKLPLTPITGVTPYYNARRYQGVMLMTSMPRENTTNDNEDLIKTNLSYMWNFRGSVLPMYAALELNNIIGGKVVYVTYDLGLGLETREFISWSTIEIDGELGRSYLIDLNMYERKIIINHTNC